MKSLRLLSLLFFFSFSVFSQNTEELKLINQQIWEPFSKAFETLDSDLFASIHNPALLRVSGDQKTIRFFDAYMAGYKDRWKDNTSIKHTISFRFFERIADKNIASERGIYKLTMNPGSQKERSFYGQFHVLHKKVDGRWKIILDYDSSENDTINEASYNSAHGIDEYDKY
ncbi:DUF4440 domain-containing protein [Winogradskyella sp. 3972H.M.0a.05]|uniref:YybH family protein n=1 Tax=Winogradskyella sp. 3972H.M.0a.05 TaxID=2950277 RepID=UPI0033957229